MGDRAPTFHLTAITVHPGERKAVAHIQVTVPMGTDTVTTDVQIPLAFDVLGETGDAFREAGLGLAETFVAAVRKALEARGVLLIRPPKP